MSSHGRLNRMESDNNNNYYYYLMTVSTMLTQHSNAHLGRECNCQIHMFDCLYVRQLYRRGCMANHRCCWEWSLGRVVGFIGTTHTWLIGHFQSIFLSLSLSSFQQINGSDVFKLRIIPRTHKWARASASIKWTCFQLTKTISYRSMYSTDQTECACIYHDRLSPTT